MYQFDRSYDKIIILGNGFDLNLKLETSYTDFINSEYFANEMRNGNVFCRHLKGQLQLKNWVDIEVELKRYSKTYQNLNFKKEYFSLSTALQSYLNSIDIEKIDRTSDAYQLITKTISDSTLILDFNYTDSVTRILNELRPTNSESSKHHVKVHGSLISNDIIFGVEDNAEINNDHIFIKKASNRNFKGVKLDRILLDARHIHVFGHSLGETDHMYFKSYFGQLGSTGYSRTPSNIYLYYHGDNSYDSLIKQIDFLTLKNLTTLKQNSNFTAVDTQK